MKKIISIFAALCLTLASFSTVMAADLPFSDVSKSDWFYNDVKIAYESGIINGKSETEYKPNDNMTYAEAIKLAACMHKLALEGEIKFDAGTPWYKPYVDYCTTNKIITKDYEYNAKATRSGYMTIFANCLPDNLLAGINNIADNSIPDVPSSAAYAPAVYKLYRAGILTGVDDKHNCNPNANIRRSEVAAILTRMNNLETRVEFSMGSGNTDEKETKTLAIKTEPKDSEITVGQTVTVSVEVEGGKEPYVYQWKGDDSGKGMYSALTEGEMVAGEDTKDLKLTFLKAGSIDVVCAVMDADGNTVTSKKATVTAKVAPLAIKEQPQDAEAKIGEKTVIAMTATGGNGSYTYKWEYELDGVWIEIKNMSEFVLSGANLLNYTPSKAGSIKVRCVVTDQDGEEVTTNAATLTVPEVKIETPLAISAQPESVTLPGTTGEVKFTVGVTGGSENNKYEWQYTEYNKAENWRKVPDNTFVKASGMEASTLLITIDDDNRNSLLTFIFRCVISDENGTSVTSDSVSFKVTK